MFLHVLDVTWLKDHELKIEFDDGSMKRVDLSDELEGEVFEPLRDPAYFRRVARLAETASIWSINLIQLD